MKRTANQLACDKRLGRTRARNGGSLLAESSLLARVVGYAYVCHKLIRTQGSKLRFQDRPLDVERLLEAVPDELISSGGRSIEPGSSPSPTGVSDAKGPTRGSNQPPKLIARKGAEWAGGPGGAGAASRPSPNEARSLVGARFGHGVFARPTGRPGPRQAPRSCPDRGAREVWSVSGRLAPVPGRLRSLGVGLGLGTVLALALKGRSIGHPQPAPPEPAPGFSGRAGNVSVERRSGIERRAAPDRRQGARGDVVGRIGRFTDRRSGVERRSGFDRRRSQR